STYAAHGYVAGMAAGQGAFKWFSGEIMGSSESILQLFEGGVAGRRADDVNIPGCFVDQRLESPHLPVVEVHGQEFQGRDLLTQYVAETRIVLVGHVSVTGPLPSKQQTLVQVTSSQ